MQNAFRIADYCLFGLTLLASATIGIFFSCRGSKQDSPDEILMGGRNMPVLPTALSLLTSFLSGITLLGIPVEIYQRGALFWFARTVGSMIALIIAAFLVLPIFYRLRPTSVYQYFQERFNSLLLRKMGALLFLLFMVFYMAIVLYAPAVALSGVTGVPTWVFIISVGCVCIIYTSYGGLKAVVWADSLQAIIMFGGVLTLFFKGASDAGGLGYSFRVSEAYGRWEGLANVDPNPFQYMNVWEATFGGIGFFASLLTFNQIALQRYLSLPTIRDARKVIAINIPTYLVLTTAADLLGIVMFAYYKDCDPLISQQVKSKDQIVIHFALQVFDSLPGMPGIFLACLFSGTLSTISSGINSMAAVTWEDFFVHTAHFKNVKPKRQSTYIKLMAASYGLIAICLAFLAEPLGGIMKSLLSVMGATAGPLVGLFVLGIFFPKANRNGAIIGVVASFLITLWISMGNVIYRPYADYSLPLSTNQCLPLFNVTFNASLSPVFRNDRYSPLGGFNNLYAISDIMFTSIGMVLVLVFGVPTSYIFKDNRGMSRTRVLTIMSLKRHRSEDDYASYASDLDNDSTINGDFNHNFKLRAMNGDGGEGKHGDGDKKAKEALLSQTKPKSSYRRKSEDNHVHGGSKRGSTASKQNKGEKH